MWLDVESVTHDAAALYSFVDSISALADQASSFVYVKASQEFFSYVSQLATSTKTYLIDFPKHLPVSSDTLKTMYRQKLTDIRVCWSAVHHFVKAARDADTLNTPFSLLLAYYERFQNIAGFKDVTFAVFHLDEVNYLQIKSSWITELAAQLQAIIPNAPPFPANLGLIGIPYSQSSAVFLNALIPHEMGHFVYQRLNKAAALEPDIIAALDATIAATGLPALTPAHRWWCLNTLHGWTEEIFCDLFALWIVGPAYAFAYIELFDLSRTLGTGVSPSEDLFFGPNHPADSCRLAQHVAFLQTLGWWPHVEKCASHFVDVLKHVAAIPESGYRFRTDLPVALETPTLPAFFRLLPSVLSSLQSLVGHLDSGVPQYAQFERSVESYFHKGIVPSTILKPSSDDDVTPRFDCPEPMTMLNVACRIYLESVHKVIALVGEDRASVAAHDKWSRRLESWAAKAFEDYSILKLSSP